MSTKASEPEAAETAELTDVQVIGFLRENPDFLERYPQLLSVIVAPERGIRRCGRFRRRGRRPPGGHAEPHAHRTRRAGVSRAAN